MMSVRCALAAAVVSVLATSPALAQRRAPDSARVARVRAELHALVAETNAALRRRDRALLEQLYAPEFIAAHANGYVNDRTTHLDEELSADSVALGRPIDPQDGLRVYGDVAVVRRRFRSTTAMWNGRTAFSTWVFARRGDAWRIVQSQSTILQPERANVRLADSLLDADAGDYGQDGRLTTRVRREGAGLVSRGVPALNPPRAMLPVSDTTFFDKLGSEYTFQRGPDRRVARMIIRAPDGRVIRRERMR